MDSDEVSSCCSPTPSSPRSSPLTNIHRPLIATLPPFADRFRDIPEPVRRETVEASMRVVQQHLERTVEQILRLNERCPACTEQLSKGVIAADVLGLEGVEEYRAMALHLLRAERSELMKRLEELEAEKLREERGRRVWSLQQEEEADVIEEDVLEIYD